MSSEALYDTDDLCLILDTRFVDWLHDRPSGGLPNDFLTKGASALFFFDTVLCDEGGLAAEERADWFLSTEIFTRLKREGILRPMDLRQLLPPGMLEDIRRSPWFQQVGQAMREEVDFLRHATASQAKRRRLLPVVPELNRLLFTSLQTDDLRYAYGGGVLRLPKELRQRDDRRRDAPGAMPEAGFPCEIDRSMALLAPSFTLLPRLSREEQALLRRNLDAEKPSDFRVLYGDPEMDLDAYCEVRKAARFREIDRQVDAARRAQALANFDTLMRVREATQDIRGRIRHVLSDVRHGNRTRQDVQRDLEAEQRELAARLGGNPARTKWDLLLASPGALLPILGRLAGTELPQSAAGTVAWSIAGVASAMGVSRLVRVWREKRRAAGLKSRYPLGWFVREFRQARDAG